MFLATTYGMWTSGTHEVDLTDGLDPSRRYLVDGGLVGRSGSGFGRVFISTEPPASDITSLRLFEVDDHAVSVTLSLRAGGGLNRD